MNLFMVEKTQIEMVSDRGYDIVDEEWLLYDDINMKKFKKLDLSHP